MLIGATSTGTCLSNLRAVCKVNLNCRLFSKHYPLADPLVYSFKPERDSHATVNFASALQPKGDHSMYSVEFVLRTTATRGALISGTGVDGDALLLQLNNGCFEVCLESIYNDTFDFQVFYSFGAPYLYVFSSYQPLNDGLWHSVYFVSSHNSTCLFVDGVRHNCSDNSVNDKQLPSYRVLDLNEEVNLCYISSVRNHGIVDSHWQHRAEATLCTRRSTSTLFFRWLSQQFTYQRP